MRIDLAMADIHTRLRLISLMREVALSDSKGASIELTEMDLRCLPGGYFSLPTNTVRNHA